MEGQHDDVGIVSCRRNVPHHRGEVLLVRNGDDAWRHARLVILRLVIGVRAHGRDAGLIGTGRIPFAKDGAERKNRNPYTISIDDCRLTRLLDVVAPANRLDAFLTKKRNRIQQSIRAPVHRMVAGNRDDIEAAIGKHGCHMRLERLVRYAGMKLKRAAQGVQAFTLRQPDIGGSERRANERAERLYRLVNRSDIAAGKQSNSIFGHPTLSHHSSGRIGLKQADRPPSAASTVPVNIRDSSEARKTAIAAMSVASPTEKG